MRINSDVPLCNFPPAVIIYSDLIQPLHCPKITRAADRLKKKFFFLHDPQNNTQIMNLLL